MSEPTMLIANPAPDRRSRARWAITALIVLILLPNLIWLAVGHGVETWIAGLLVPALLLLVLFAVLGDAPWLACLLLAPFAALAPAEACYIATYLHPSDADILATIVATNPREANEYLGHALVPILLCTAAGLLLALMAAWWGRQAGIVWRHRSRAWVLTAAITLPLAVLVVAFATTTGSTQARAEDATRSLVSLGDPIASGYPFGLLPRIVQYRREWQRMRWGSMHLDAFRFHAHRSNPVHARQVYVLVIGESSRRDHWQLFGYARATNPELGKVSNLIPIPDMVTSWPASILAIPLVITRKPVTDRHLAGKEASILRAMSEAGFDTYWISNQMAIGQFDSPVSVYAYEAQHVEFLNHASWTAAGSYDEVLLQPLRDALQDSHRDLFIVLHTMGSHQGYDFRYPAGFRIFRPVQSDPGSAASLDERIRNSYDNTIVYTDHVLAEVIGILRRTDAITALFYESDHGEDLPTSTCSLNGHGNTTRYDFQIPALFWYSNAYAEAFPQPLAALRANAGQRVMSHDTFESLIDMAGIDFPGHDRSFSLFSPQWRYRPRTITGMWQVDIDDAMFGKHCEIAMPRHAG